MRRPRSPLFLVRTVYRKRRLRDAARMLPVIGMFLLVLPLLWGAGADDGTGRGWVYVFVVWAGLIAAAAAMAPGLAASDAEADAPGEDR